MARGVNKVILIGNVGGDPETRYMPNGNAVTNITLATTDSWKDKQTGQLQERTEWHRVVLFGEPRKVPRGVEIHPSNVQAFAEALGRCRRFLDRLPSSRRIPCAGNRSA